MKTNRNEKVINAIDETIDNTLEGLVVDILEEREEFNDETIMPDKEYIKEAYNEIYASYFGEIVAEYMCEELYDRVKEVLEHESLDNK